MLSAFANATEKYSYVYDEANQLVRENLYYGSGNANNATYTYTYDDWGNILTKSAYDYTTATTLPGVALDTVIYGYSDSDWGDILSYMTIGNRSYQHFYDDMGNPTSYLGVALAWEGKQLVSHSTGGSGGKAILTTFAYDENGLRTQKIYNSITTTKYYYNGSVLMGMVTGTGTTAVHQLFSYDSSGNVVSVDYSTNGGSTFTTYYYVRNAQNDVVKLISASGTTVVEYTYDTWGKLLSTTGSLATTLGVNQPFRYRSYVYDTETGLYYVSSRYYDPEIGRWISPEPNVYAGAFDRGVGLVGYNVYAYCANNPVNYYDPTGEFVISTLLICVAAGAIIGGTMSILTGIGIGGLAGGALGYFAASAVVSATGVAGISVTSGGISTIAALGTSFGKLGILIANNGEQIIDWGKTTWHGM